MTWLILTHPDFELFILIFTNLQVYLYQFGYQNMLYVLVRTGNSFDTIKKICYFDCLRILSPPQSLSHSWIKQPSSFRPNRLAFAPKCLCGAAHCSLVKCVGTFTWSRAVYKQHRFF